VLVPIEGYGVNLLASAAGTALELFWYNAVSSLRCFFTALFLYCAVSSLLCFFTALFLHCSVSSLLCVFSGLQPDVRAPAGPAAKSDQSGHADPVS
jgi:hypothetical protein